MNPVRRRILVTGAAGRIGRVLSAAWKHRYELTLADVAPIPPLEGARTVRADVCEPAAMESLCSQADTVIHLAISGNLPDPRSLHHRVNVDGARHVMRAAARAGCRRVVHASSLSIELFPDRDYAAMKQEVEAIARGIAESGALSIHCLRLGRVMAATDRALWPTSDDITHVLTHADLVRLFACSIEASADTHFGVFRGVSKYAKPVHDITESARRLGYEPQDDVIALAARNFHSPLGLARRAKRRLKTIWT